MFKSKAKYISGKNVSGSVISVEKKIVDLDPYFGYIFNLDFRVDRDTGERMRSTNERVGDIFLKMRRALNHCITYQSMPKTGTFVILANHKVLHSRGFLEEKQLYKPNCSKANRLLFRSKGPSRDRNFYADLDKLPF